MAGFILAMFVTRLAFFAEQLPARQFSGLLLGAGLVTLIGAVDDRFHLAARFKLAVQVLAASILPIFGIGITVISNPMGQGWLAPPSWVAWVLTVVWVVAVTNAINLIDGIDGLAAGVSAIACTALACLGLMLGQPGVALVAAALAGSAAGFVGWNFNPAKIFMGDTGAYFLGFMIGGITVLAAFKMAASISIFIPLLVLVVPLLEAGLSTLRRSLRGQPVFSADREHIHHRLLEMGLSQRAIAVLMYCVTAVCCIIAVWISRPQ
ncbi:MAG: undecaprenyl/decaprenyl-phosphate alpha-N-acetylglucosaminyl 1-phosphate transferase [Armatimonadetes bacterium]|nr:undecaprenyl/decaprenyl-phosphate alpha-N-acetylglucosaminyl 1-phosphate transferase [Armatimonadota bacterium]NIM23146.1 undecaprenyl/decaprenyl-phosphate alpha-N-acetylglucosaminyl 1-phosphate transferase [Armatimonadota bacterium]NIM67014.1 undecaprenyl/decaprenyl-phosphate alpha-N-acetylglucosaminyl 1-phosphate transferase [Armatimonadota bacterium]NIM75548.1 undecaprenyl/decaprenyl-phosphate alpha-N-acetylglucosaminyl 1-phosphate transferase [Armatimonadota bacterium]NIN05203.1 undecapr